jgi:hypothetical protein
MTAPPLLRGLGVPAGATPAERRAAAILAALGAELRPDPQMRSSLVRDTEPTTNAPTSGSGDRGDEPLRGLLADGAEPFPGLPAGVVEQALALALAAAAVDGALRDRSVDVSAPGVLAQLYLPAVMAASYGAPPARHCPEPLPVGAGAVQADLGAEGAAESFKTLLGSLSPEEREDPERLAAAAQLWRLPVLPYRSGGRGVRGEVTVAARASGPGGEARPADPPARDPVGDRRDEPAGAPREGAPAADRRGILDLTAMWAGPLASWLLAAGGDRVWKVEPQVRLDGMRALDGRGIHPPGVDAESGEASAMFNALNRGKRRLDLDLREPEARRELLDRAADCDLVLENFSPRVLGNLRIGYEVLAGASPGITVISLPALPPGTAESDWVAYGAGVHAIGGLGETDAGFRAPAFAYPDVLAGLHAHLVALAVRFGRAHGNWAGGHLIAPMSAALPPRDAFVACPAYGNKRRTQGLVDVGQHGAMVAAGHAGARSGLAAPPADADRFGASLSVDPAADFVTLTDGAGTHRYPRSPFRSGPAPDESPAPALHTVAARG